MTTPSQAAAPFDDVLSELRFYVRQKNPRTALLKKELDEIGHALRTSHQGREWARLLNGAAAKGSDGLARYITSLGDQVLMSIALKNPNLSEDWVIKKFHSLKKTDSFGMQLISLPIMRALTKSDRFPPTLFDDVISGSGFLGGQSDGMWQEAIQGVAQNSQIKEQHIDKILAIVNDESPTACRPGIKSSLLALIVKNPVTPERYVLDYLASTVPGTVPGVDFTSTVASVATYRPLTPELLDAILAVNNTAVCVSLGMNRSLQPMQVEQILAAAAQDSYFDNTVASIINGLSDSRCSANIPQVMQNILKHGEPFLPKAYLDDQGVSRRLCQILSRTEHLPLPSFVALLPYSYLNTVEGKTALNDRWPEICAEVLAGRFDFTAPDRDGVSFLDAFRRAPEVYEKLLALQLEMKTQNLLTKQEQPAPMQHHSRKL